MDRKEYNRQYSKKYHALNRDRLIEQMRTYNNTHKSQIRDQRIDHRILNREQINERQRERYLLKKLSVENIDMSESYYERNKERIHEYYLKNKEELKQKALQRYYLRKEQQLQNGELPKRAGRPSNKYVDPTPYVFKIERLDKSNLSE
jgi:hypothetical protein